MIGLTTEQQARLKELKTLVSVRVDEYSEQADEVGDNDVNLGDIEYELNKSAREVSTRIDRSTGFRATRNITDYSVALSGKHGGGRIPLPEDYLRFVSLKMEDWEIPVNQLISDQSRAYRQMQYTYRRGTKEQPKGFLVPMKESSYAAGIVPAGKALCSVKTKPADDEFISVGAEVTLDAENAGVVSDISDPDYVWVTLNEGDTFSVGDTLTSSGAWELSVDYVAGNNYSRPGYKQAIEFWPYKSGDDIEELIYIPYLKAVEMPLELEDALVWYTVYKILAIAERYESAKNAYDQYQQAVNNVNKGFKGEDRGQGNS